EAADLFASDRIALVRHRGTAALLAAERLFGFADFGALQVANLDGDFFERSGDERQRAEVVRMTIPLNDLGSHRRDIETEALADALFDFRAEVRSIAYGTGDFTDAHLGSGVGEALDVALIFRVPVGNFEAESDRLGMNAVGAADLRRVPEFLRAASQDLA